MRWLFQLLPVLILLLLVVHPVAAQGATGVQFMVLNGQNQPVAGLTFTLIASDDTSHTLLTDAKGEVAALALPGNYFRITAAQQPDGSTVEVEGTTLDQGMRLGLIPDQTRTVLLRLDSNLLFVDPEAIFAGTDAPLTLATTEALAAAPLAPASDIAATTTGGGASTEATSVPVPVSRFRWVGWVVGAVIGLVILVPLTVMGVRAIALARTQPRRPKL